MNREGNSHVRCRSLSTQIPFSETAGLMPVDRDSCELLLAIARRPCIDTQQIYELARNVRDWDSLFRLAEEHRVLSMLFSRLADAGPEVPPTVRERLQAEYHRNIFHSVANSVELIHILKAFDQESI